MDETKLLDRVNGLKYGDTMKYIYNQHIDYIDYKLYPFSDNKLIMKDTETTDKEIILKRLSTPPSKYTQYEYIGYNNNLFTFMESNGTCSLKLRAFQFTDIVPYLNNGKVTIRYKYMWNSYLDSISQYWTYDVPVIFSLLNDV